MSSPVPPPTAYPLVTKYPVPFEASNGTAWSRKSYDGTESFCTWSWIVQLSGLIKSNWAPGAEPVKFSAVSPSQPVDGSSASVRG
jgi:hypothetical protein